MKTSELGAFVLLFITIVYGIIIVQTDRRVDRLEEKWAETPPILEIQEKQRAMELWMKTVDEERKAEIHDILSGVHDN